METSGFSGATPDQPVDDVSTDTDAASDVFTPAPAPSFDPGSALLAPEEPETAGSSGLPMSLTIAADEAATVDLPVAEPSRGSTYESFYDPHRRQRPHRT